MKFNYDLFHIDKALGNFQKSDSNKHKNKYENKKNNVRRAQDPFRVQIYNGKRRERVIIALWVLLLTRLQ